MLVVAVVLYVCLSYDAISIVIMLLVVSLMQHSSV